MVLKVIGSSSSGNSYILGNDDECLIIELGFPFEVIKKALGFNLKKVAAACVTHNHGDHAKGVKKAIDSGIDVIISEGTAKAIGVYGNHRAKIIKHGGKYKAGNFTIKAFDVQHDAENPVGFLIDHSETGLICFITDSYFVKYSFPGVKHFLVEANYEQSILAKSVEEGKIHPAQYQRTRKSHMSIDTCVDFLLANDLKIVQNIILLHLSNQNSNADSFRERVIQETGKKVYIARPGLTIENFSSNPF